MISEDGSWEIIVKPPFGDMREGSVNSVSDEPFGSFRLEGDIRLSAMRLQKILGFPLLIEAEARGRHTFHDFIDRSDWHVHVREAQYGRAPLRETIRIPQQKTDILTEIDFTLRSAIFELIKAKKS